MNLNDLIDDLVQVILEDLHASIQFHDIDGSHANSAYLDKMRPLITEAILVWCRGMFQPPKG